MEVSAQGIVTNNEYLDQFLTYQDIFFYFSRISKGFECSLQIWFSPDSEIEYDSNSQSESTPTQ